MTDGLIDILVERLNGLMPRVAIVLGSGLGSLVEEVSDPIRVPYADLPGFPPVAFPVMRANWSRVISAASLS